MHIACVRNKFVNRSRQVHIILWKHLVWNASISFMYWGKPEQAPN